MRNFYVSSVVFLALGASVTATRLRRRRLQECPLPSAVLCTFQFEQVDCGGCIYNNQCLADAAGQTECTLVEDDVEKEEVQEEEACPLPSADGLCTLELEPVTCGSNSCPYDNFCLADKAGFTVDEECNRVEPNTNSAQQNNCPTPSAGTACGLILLPVFCQGGCQYDNACLANAVGFTDCSPTEPFCPTPLEPVACTGEEVNPVECGALECWYENECLAAAAGFVGCTPAGAVSPCKRSTGADCSGELLEYSETIDPSSDMGYNWTTTMDPTMDETGALTEAPVDFDSSGNDPTSCSSDGVQFTCHSPTELVAGDNVTSINNVIRCDLGDTLSSMDFRQADNCECSAELSQPIVGTDDIRERTCACVVCPRGSALALSLDCSVVPEDPVIVGSCVSIDCNGRCIQ